jgi:hypothetical protein
VNEAEREKLIKKIIKAVERIRIYDPSYGKFIDGKIIQDMENGYSGSLYDYNRNYKRIFASDSNGSMVQYRIHNDTIHQIVKKHIFQLKKKRVYSYLINPLHVR